MTPTERQKITKGVKIALRVIATISGGALLRFLFWPHNHSAYLGLVLYGVCWWLSGKFSKVS